MRSGSFNPRLNPLPTQYQFASRNPLPTQYQFASRNPPNVPQFQPSNLPINPQIHHLHSNSLLDDETKLRNEVIYLHSLWHRGPPSQTQTQTQTQTPHFLKPSTSTLFKKSHKTHLVSDKEWPIDSIPNSPSPSASTWPEFKPTSAPVSRPATAEERQRVLSVKIHLKGLDSCSGLFHIHGGNATDDDDDDDDEDEEDEEDDGDDAKEYDFLMKVFEEDDDLRGYYEKNCESGEFYCLVCGVIGNKLKRKYKDCVALVQHSVTISNTKKRMAHRAYAHVICKVLGWDIHRLPSVPFAVRDATRIDQSVEKSCELQNETKVTADGCETDDHGGLKEEGVRCNSENVQVEKKKTCDSAQGVTNKMVEGCSAFGGEPVDCGLSSTGDVAK